MPVSQCTRRTQYGTSPSKSFCSALARSCLCPPCSRVTAPSSVDPRSTATLHRKSTCSCLRFASRSQSWCASPCGAFSFQASELIGWNGDRDHWALNAAQLPCDLNTHQLNDPLFCEFRALLTPLGCPLLTFASFIQHLTNVFVLGFDFVVRHSTCEMRCFACCALLETRF